MIEKDTKLMDFVTNVCHRLSSSVISADVYGVYENKGKEVYEGEVVFSNGITLEVDVIPTHGSMMYTVDYLVYGKRIFFDGKLVGDCQEYNTPIDEYGVWLAETYADDIADMMF